jgi:hypothetical protein
LAHALKPKRSALAAAGSVPSALRKENHLTLALSPRGGEGGWRAARILEAQLQLFIIFYFHA